MNRLLLIVLLLLCILVKPSFVLADNPSSAIDLFSKDLIAYFPCNEGNGNMVTDATHGNAAGIFQGGVSWGEGKFGRGLAFNGVDSLVSMSDSAALAGRTGLTVSTWFFLNNLDADQELIHRGSSANYHGYFYLFFYKSSNVIILDVEDAVTKKHVYAYSRKVTGNTWHHVTAMVSATSLVIYLDGIPGDVVTFNGLYPLMTVNTNEYARLHLGGLIYDTLTPRNPLNGMLDDVRIYNRVFNVNEEAMLGSAVNQALDPAGPARSAGAPSGVLPTGVRSVAITLKTSLNARCVYATQPGTDYAQGIPMTVTNGLEHWTNVWDLPVNTAQDYFIRCLGMDGSINTTDYAIHFTTGPQEVVPAQVLQQGDIVPGQTKGILDNWAWYKQYYFTSTVPRLAAGDTFQLYFLQGFTNNLLVYSFQNKIWDLFDDILKIYLDPYKYLQKNEAGEYRWIYQYPQTTSPSLLGTEVQLYSSQFIYALTNAFHMIASLDPAQQTDTMKTFVAQYGPVILDFYTRKEVTLRPVIQRQLAAGLAVFETSNALSDQTLWILAGTGELLAAHQLRPSLLTIPAGKESQWRSLLSLGYQLIVQRFSWSELTDFSGHKVRGLNVDLGMYSKYVDNQYAGYAGAMYPGWKVLPTEKVMDPVLVDKVGWDISHAQRFVNVFRTFYENKDLLGFNFPSREIMRGLTNQFVYGAFNKDMAHPLFNNYMDGTNGWYRVNYENTPGYGYAPSTLSFSAVCAGYGFWSEFNPDVTTVMKALVNVLTSTDSAVLAWKKLYYAGWGSQLTTLMFFPSITAWDNAAGTAVTGDVSGDGRVTMYDAALVLKYTVGGPLTSEQQAQADTNGDTTVNAADAMAIAKKAVGLNL